MFLTIKLCIHVELIVCIKIDLTLNNLQRLICHKTQITNQRKYSSWLGFLKQRSRWGRFTSTAVTFVGRCVTSWYGRRGRSWLVLDGIMLRFLILCLLSLWAALRVFSKEETTWLVVRRQGSPLGWAIGDGWCERHQRIFSRCPWIASLVLPLLRWPVERSLHSMSLDWQWSPPLETCPTQ